MQSHICKVYYACLAVKSVSVTDHLHFWQNDWDLLGATVTDTGVERIPT